MDQRARQRYSVNRHGHPLPITEEKSRTLVTPNSPLVELIDARKAYPGVLALDGVDFSLQPGEVRALLGKNGAGKSTLIKVLGGTERLNSGRFRVMGQDVQFRSPSDAIRAGIATVHQELASIPEMTVAENISLGRWPHGRSGIDWKEVDEVAKRALAQLSVDVPINQPLGRLSLASAQLVEIARALSIGARLLVLDEPTSSLAVHEVDLLLDVVKRLSDTGIAIIYISHRMDEIERLASSVTVMRDGRNVGTLAAGEATNERVVELMVGEALEEAPTPLQQVSTHEGEVVLEVSNVQVPGRVFGADLSVRAGEVVGIAGLLGSGRTELLRSIVGAQARATATVKIRGRRLTRRSIASTRAAGIVMTPEDRRGEGAITMLGIDENLVMSSWGRVSAGGVIRKKQVQSLVDASIRDLRVKAARPTDAMATLSGGNQQKVVIGKALNTQPSVLLLDEPTRGVDVEAKQQIYLIVRQLAHDGLAVVVVSSETEELLEVCDRVVVMRNGRTHESVPREDLTRDLLFALMMRKTDDD